jgi:hypothetical protein
MSANSVSRRSLLSLLLMGMAPPCALADEARSVDELIARLHAAVNADRAMNIMREVYARDRWFTFPKFRETTEYLQRTLREHGIQEIETLAAPADGKTQAGFWTMPLAWDVKSARLEIVEPPVSSELRVLADFEKVPASLGMWSGPTPKGGVTAEIVEVEKLTRSALEKAGAKGKLVLTTQNPGGAKALLAKHGALGAINAYTENKELEDGRQWINAWGDYGWGYTKTSTPLLVFSVTPRQLTLLRKLMAGGKTVRVRAEVDSRYYEGEYPYVTGAIAGSTAEEVLVLGHTAEQGAHDNATGVAVMLEALATLQRLISTGELPRPRRGIRMLAMPEMYGSMHYVATHPERMKNTVAAMCLDTPAGPQNLAGTEYTFYLNPHSAKSYTDALMLRIARSHFRRVNRPFHWREYMSGTDTFLADPMIGVATVWPYSGTGIHSHHNSEDKPETVDPRGLRDLATVTAAYLYYIAKANDADAPWLAAITADRGLGEILRAATEASERILQANARGPALWLGIEQVRYLAAREREAMRSISRIAPGANLEPAVRRLDRFAEAQIERLRDIAGVEPEAPEPDAQILAGAGLVVKRKRFGTLPLDDVPPAERKGYPNGAWSGVAIAALYWCDGNRDLAEVIRLTRHELGPTKFDFTGYFQFLAERGYVELRTVR